MRELTVALLLALGTRVVTGDGDPLHYFPLHVGNWWAYEEQGEDGKALSRETWTVVGGEGDEFHLRAMTKRFDALGEAGRRWEDHEYLRAATDGLHKRYPAGREAGLEVLLVKEPARPGTRWHDAQGDCEVTAGPESCRGPRGELPDCVRVVCRLGKPTATVVTSTYSGGVGMVRQEVDVVRLVPAFEGAAAAVLPEDSASGGHSLLRLTAYHVAP
jgi:hypothetical protein